MSWRRVPWRRRRRCITVVILAVLMRALAIHRRWGLHHLGRRGSYGALPGRCVLYLKAAGGDRPGEHHHVFQQLVLEKRRELPWAVVRPLAHVDCIPLDEDVHYRVEIDTAHILIAVRNSVVPR